MQRLDDSFELLVSADSSGDSAAAHSVWLTVLAAAALPGYASARAEIHSRVQTWKVGQSEHFDLILLSCLRC